MSSSLVETTTTFSTITPATTATPPRRPCWSVCVWWCKTATQRVVNRSSEVWRAGGMVATWKTTWKGVENRLYVVYYKKNKATGSAYYWWTKSWNNEKKTSIDSYLFFHLNWCLPLSISLPPNGSHNPVSSGWVPPSDGPERAADGHHWWKSNTFDVKRKMNNAFWTKAIHFFAVLLRQIIHVCLISANFLWHEENHMIRLDPWSI